MIKNQKSTTRRSEQGFTLLETTLIMIVASIIFATAGASLIEYLKQNRIETTQNRLERIEYAMQDFLRKYRRYPCAADRTLAPTQANFGREQAGACGNTSNVLEGAVPNRTLNLPDEFSKDAWGNKFTFAITQRQALILGYSTGAGNVRVEDQAGNALNASADYVVVSHGFTGAGGYWSGQSAVPRIGCDAVARDGENCNGDRVFLSMLSNVESAAADYFDDYVLFQYPDASADIPPGAIFFMTADGCPYGWFEYANAEGHLIVGVGNVPMNIIRRIDTASLQPTSSAVGGPSVLLTRSIPTGGASRSENPNEDVLFPRYRTLRLCEKLP